MKTARAKGMAICMAALLGTEALRAQEQYRIDYIKGDVARKTEAVRRAGELHDNALCLEAIDFALEVQALLPGDPDMDALAQAAVRGLSRDGAGADAAKVTARLGEAFRQFSSPGIRTEVLGKFSEFPSPANVSLVNAFITEKVQQGAPMDAVLLKAVDMLRGSGNNTSFSILFIADLLGIWPDYRQRLQDAYTPLANSCENEILSILANVGMDKKLEILEITSGSDAISQKISGEVAESALSDSITNITDVRSVPQAQLDLQIASLQAIADIQWTRAAVMVTGYFDIARREYESDLLTPEQFSGIITNVANVASPDTGQVLSLYLDALNKGMEQNDVPEEPVILSVINALGGLGDKTAFDYLLYVTYLDYPESVVLAARTALAKLKW